jgi:flagellar basal-body rod modification protein FlgD
MTISTGNSYLDSLTSASSSALRRRRPSRQQTIDQNDFLKLLTTQMTMQDPTAPTDNNQMVAADGDLLRSPASRR